MANTPPTSCDTTMGNGNDATCNAAMGNDGEGSAPTAKAWAAEQFVRMPITGDSPAKKALEAARVPTLAEHDRREWLEQVVEARERTAVKSQHHRCSVSP